MVDQPKCTPVCVPPGPGQAHALEMQIENYNERFTNLLGGRARKEAVELGVSLASPRWPAGLWTERHQRFHVPRVDVLLVIHVT